MSNSSDLLKTPLASLYFKPTLEGQMAIFVIVFLIGVPVSGVPAIKALASGRLTFDLFQAAFFLIMAIMTGAALIAKLKGQRAAK